MKTAENAAQAEVEATPITNRVQNPVQLGNRLTFCSFVGAARVLVDARLA